MHSGNSEVILKNCSCYGLKGKGSNTKNEKYKEYYIERLSREIAGYTGTEMIRRVVGDAKVLELTSLEVSETKLLLERELLQKE